MKKFYSLVLLLMACPTILSAQINPTLAPMREVKKLNLTLPFLGLGAIELGRDWGIGGKNSLHPGESIAKATLETAIKYNWKVIDTASSYHLSEERIGHFIPRTKYQYLLITKPGEHSIKANDPRCKKAAYDQVYCLKPAAEYDFSRAAIFKDVTESLKYLNVKTLDIVLLHLHDKDAHSFLAKGEAIKALEELRAQEASPKSEHYG